MSRDSAEPVCPFRAGRFICSPLKSNGRGGFKLVEEVGEGLLQSAFPFSRLLPPWSSAHWLDSDGPFTGLCHFLGRFCPAHPAPQAGPTDLPLQPWHSRALVPDSRVRSSEPHSLPGTHTLLPAMGTPPTSRTCRDLMTPVLNARHSRSLLFKVTPFGCTGWLSLASDCCHHPASLCH